ncbi:MAG TPA: AAA family ATPase [Candidatus Onthocola stercoravium]|nr:AAA family ATPase [Candidatus Onthocola stercoravium]
MLERKITKELLEWKNEKNKPCLLIKGARNVGKTYIISEFAKDNYQSLIYINFETMPKYKEIFNGNLDIDTLIMKLELYFPNTEIIPNNTILLLDVIEFCPNARVALKSFALDGRIDVVASGSLLGLILILLNMQKMFYT